MKALLLFFMHEYIVEYKSNAHGLITKIRIINLGYVSNNLWNEYLNKFWWAFKYF